MAAGLVFTWLGIAFLATFVIKYRAGVSLWYRPKVFGPNGFGLAWFLHASIKAAFWPITLGYWLSNGRPEPQVVFNERARQREARMAHATRFKT